ncbi:hypothetical protein [Lysobacter niastensis]|uniref:Uncharacterized protein n=1 Tax=Lysobacter niastensis TaxID=380629 RepID=A0ABS0B702_9GAMM|nr:hypothetical protein [Lysobacter niastensis]MBF6023436.1 hypothetical protein [Lysobacter niastensis]
MESLAACFVLVASLSASAADPVRIDGTTDQSANESFNRMVEQIAPEKRMDLQVAMLLIVMDGVGSAKEAMTRPELRNPSIVLIKDRVNGMTADELIALSKTSTTKQAP